MDNITHSLAGLVIAEAAVRLRARRGGAEPSPDVRAAAALSSMARRMKSERSAPC